MDSVDNSRDGSVKSEKIVQFSQASNPEPNYALRPNENSPSSSRILQPQSSIDHDAMSLNRSTYNSSDNLVQPATIPKDKFRLVCIGFTILGITTLLPWNFFITATDYWMYKFRNVSGDYKPDQPHSTDRTPLQTFFESYLAIASNLPMLISMTVNSLYGQRFSAKKRLYVSLTVMLIIFATTTMFAHINTDEMQTIFFAITMVMVTINSFFSAIFQAAIFGIVASFPSHCMHAMVNGQAIAGILAVVLQVISMVNNTEPLMSGLYYFLVSTIFLISAIILYWMMDNDYTRYYLVKLSDDDHLSTSISVNMIESKQQIIETLQECWQLAATVSISFAASLAVFPGVCVLIVPQHPNISFFSGRFFTPIATFLLFSCGDLAGRLCSTLAPFPVGKKNSLLVFTAARAIIPILILFCNVQPRMNLPVLFTSDIYFPILNGLSALTNGYLFSSAMVMASAIQPRDRLEITGFVMAAALGIGLTLGSISSTLLLMII